MEKIREMLGGKRSLVLVDELGVHYRLMKEVPSAVRAYCSAT
ncbi:MAG: hypothetical protein ABDH61_03080 [Acidilobaceae archaeon]